MVFLVGLGLALKIGLDSFVSTGHGNQSDVQCNLCSDFPAM